MVKLLHKKEISTEESPIMLQRRHTIMEVDKDGNLADPKLKSITRSSSTSSLNQTKNKPPAVNSTTKQADTTLSPDGSISASIASTVVITDSELSSSWLYNNKKAQITPEPAKTFNSSRVTEMRDEMSSPMLPKSKMRSNSMVRGRAKTSSCCCYALIIIIIGVAALGILAAIASILYMEFFASYNATDLQITTPKSVSRDSVPLKKVGHSLGEKHQILDRTKSPGRVSESILFPDSSTKGSEKSISSGEQSFDKNIIAVEENKKDVIVNETDSSNVIINDLLNLTSQMIKSATTDPKGILNPINNLFSRNQNLESHYSKLFELYQGLRSTGSSEEKSVKSEPHETISQTVDVSNKDDSISDDSNSMQLLEDGENSNIEEIKDIVKNSSDAVNKIASELAQDSSMVEEGAAKDTFVVDKESLSDAEGAVKDSSVSENTKDLFGVSDEVARDVSVAEDMSKNLSEEDDDLSHFRINNVVEEKNLQDISNIPFLNPSEKFEPLQKEISKLNLEVEELESVPNDSEKIETISHKPAIAIPEENLGFPNSFRTLDIDFEEKINNEQSKVSDPDQPLANLPIVGTTNSSNFIPKFLSQLDRSWGFPNFFRNSDEDLSNNAQKEQTSVPADDTDAIDLNRPVLETNIAVPRPVEMIRRFGNVHNEKNDRFNELSQQDRQFSLAKALDRLRLLDANNILPSSRQKSKTASQKKKEEPKIQTNQEVASERSHYLENLRKRLFDNE